MIGCHRSLINIVSQTCGHDHQLNSDSFLFPPSLHQFFPIPDSFSLLSDSPFADSSMAETTSTLCFSTLSPSIPFSKDWSSPSFPKFSSHFHRHRSPYLNFSLKASGSSHSLGDDAFGFYPWENHDSADSCISSLPPLAFLMTLGQIIFGCMPLFQFDLGRISFVSSLGVFTPLICTIFFCWFRCSYTMGFGGEDYVIYFGWADSDRW